MAQITINNWQQGIAPSPLVGFGNMVNVDIHGKKGALQASSRSINEITKAGGRINWLAQDPDTGNIYALFSDGSLYKRAGSGGSWSEMTGYGTSLDQGNGLGVFNGYLYKARNGILDRLNISTFVWSNDWAFFTSQPNITSVTHPMKRGQDNSLYIGDGKYISKVDSSGVFSAQALDLPQGYQIKAIDELGRYLAILAKEQNASQVAIFPWNRVASSFIDPVFLRETSATSLLSTDNNLLIQAGSQSNVYSTNLSSYSEAARIDFIEKISRNPISAGNQTLDQTASELLLAIGSSNGTTTAIPGVYSIKDGAISIKWLSSEGDEAYLAVSNVMVVSSGEILIGWTNADASTTGIDAISDFTDKYRDYSSYVESALYSVGSSQSPIAFTVMSVYLADNLTVNDGFKIEYRKSLSDEWTLVADYDFSTIGGVSEFHFPAAIAGIANIQFKVSVKDDCKIDKIIVT